MKIAIHILVTIALLAIGWIASVMMEFDQDVPLILRASVGLLIACGAAIGVVMFGMAVAFVSMVVTDCIDRVKMSRERRSHAKTLEAEWAAR